MWATMAASMNFGSFRLREPCCLWLTGGALQNPDLLFAGFQKVGNHGIHAIALQRSSSLRSLKISVKECQAQLLQAQLLPKLNMFMPVHHG